MVLNCRFPFLYFLDTDLLTENMFENHEFAYKRLTVVVEQKQRLFLIVDIFKIGDKKSACHEGFLSVKKF